MLLDQFSLFKINSTQNYLQAIKASSADIFFCHKQYKTQKGVEKIIENICARLIQLNQLFYGQIIRNVWVSRSLK